MNTVRLACVVVLLAAQCFAIDQHRMLWAIAAVETGHRPRPGRSGETGAHQLMPGTIRDNRDAPGHLAWIIRNMERPTPYDIALVWNAGLTRVRRGQTLPRHHDHARRVANVYEAISLDRYGAVRVAGGK